MMLSAAVCQSQRIIERLPDGSIRVEIDDKQYLAITREQLDSWQILQNNFDAAQKVNTEQVTQIRELTLQVELKAAQAALEKQKADSLQTDFERAREDARRNFGLFMSERELRVEAQSFIPKGNASGFWGKALDFLNSQPAQIGFKLVIPTAQAIKVFAGRCQ